MVNVRLSLLVVSLGCLLAGSQLGAAEADFDARWREAEENVKASPGKEYFNDVFFKEFHGRYAVIVNQCTKKTGTTLTSELKALVELGGTGQVLSVLVRPQSSATGCFADVVKKETFSKPPKDGFRVPVVVTFTRQ
jgi:hypothetical protein